MKWFTAKAQADNPRAASIVIDRPIGSDWAPDWISDFTGQEPAREFIEAVEALGELDEIHLELNSPGGDVASGVRIFNYLRNHRASVHVRVTGQAASIATVVMMAGDTRTMGVGTTIMTHRAASLMLGFYTAAEMKEMASNVEVIDAAIVDAYVASTGKTADEINGLLDQGDTFMGADEAIEWGFATDQDAKLKAVACADPQLFLNQIKQQGKIRDLEAQLARKVPPGPTTMTAAEALALAFDITPEEAEAQAADLGDQIIALRQQVPAVAKVEDIPAGLLEEIRAAGPGALIVGNSAEEVTAAERSRVTAILKACQTAGTPQLVEKLITNGMAAEQASEYILDVAAAGDDAGHIFNGHSPEGGHKKPIDYQKIYDRQNRRPGA